MSLCFRGSGDMATSGNRLLICRTHVTCTTSYTGRLYTTPASLELDPVIRSKNASNGTKSLLRLNLEILECILKMEM